MSDTTSADDGMPMLGEVALSRIFLACTGAPNYSERVAERVQWELNTLWKSKLSELEKRHRIEAKRLADALEIFLHAVESGSVHTEIVSAANHAIGALELMAATVVEKEKAG